MTWSSDGRRVTAPNGTVVTFDFDIRETAEVGSILVVLLHVPHTRVCTENVFGVSEDGKVIWQIERTAANSTDPVNVYTGFSGHDGQAINVFNWNGTSNLVDVRNGHVLQVGIAK
jgi:hypothetical protein